MRIEIIDGLDSQQRKVTLTLLRWPDLAGNGRACSQSKLANLTGRDIDVVGARQVTIRQDLERTLSIHQAVAAETLLEQADDQVLPLHLRSHFDSLAFRRLSQLSNRHSPQLIELLDTFASPL